MYNENFIFDIYLLVTKNLNPFSLDKKLSDKNKHEMICMLWKECMLQKFYQHIYKEKTFLYLNSKNVLQPKVSEIITDLLRESLKITLNLEITSFSIRISFNMSILMFSLRFIPQSKGEVLILRGLFMLCSRPTRTKKDWDLR